MIYLCCKIIVGEIPADKVYEDDQAIAFNDINPQAPTHVLIVPKRHLSTLNDLSTADDALVGALVRSAAAVAKEKGCDGSGYRTVRLQLQRPGRPDGVSHPPGTWHLLGGRTMAWPPG